MAQYYQGQANKAALAGNISAAAQYNLQSNQAANDALAAQRSQQFQALQQAEEYQRTENERRREAGLAPLSPGKVGPLSTKDKMNNSLRSAKLNRAAIRIEIELNSFFQYFFHHFFFFLQKSSSTAPSPLCFPLCPPPSLLLV